jgi:guanylate kinase
MKKSNIFIISGPSGAGEDSIIEGLREYFPIERVITTTTRTMRSGESQGNPYYFISREDFEKEIKSDQFAEYAEEYNSNYYGTTIKELDRVRNSEKIGIWKIEYKGVMIIKNKYPEIVAILINTSNIGVLEDRIRRRDNVSEEYIKERTKYTKEWLKHIDIYDHTVINEEGKLKKAIQEVVAIIKNYNA